jgi:hypothetical protein
MVYFNTPPLSFWRDLDWKMLGICNFSKAIGQILWPSGNFVVIWYFSPFCYIVPPKIWQPGLT